MSSDFLALARDLPSRLARAAFHGAIGLPSHRVTAGTFVVALLYDGEVLDAWYALFKTGDPSRFMRLQVEG